MYQQKLLQLLPYMALHLVFAIAVCLAVYLILVKWLKALKFHWSAAVVIGAALSVYTWGGVLINMIELHPKPTETANAPAPSAAKSETELKGEFLKAIDDLTSHPDMVKPEVVSQLFTQFSSVVKTPQDKVLYFKNILQVYECQRYFLLDAQASLKAKKPIKSPERAACEKTDGSFFNRPTLLSPEVVANNDKLIATVAKKDLTAEEKKQFSGELIQTTLDQQARRIETTKKIFQ